MFEKLTYRNVVVQGHHEQLIIVSLVNSLILGNRNIVIILKGQVLDLVFKQPNSPENCKIHFPCTYRGADKSLARPGRKQATATEDFDFDISYL
jgi:hypothetical protein